MIGNIKPIDEKSEAYGVLDLSKQRPEEWQRLDLSAVADSKDPDAKATEVSDVVYQSKKNASTISLNSACRQNAQYSDSLKGLRDLSNLLFFGISDIMQRDENQLSIQGTPALQTTVRGKIKSEDIMIRTVVLHRHSCIYDMVYLTPPDRFKNNETDFSQFVASLRLK